MTPAAASAPPLSQSLDAFQQQQQQQQQPPPPLPPGWEVLVDSSGREYYGNASLRVTQYQHPGMCSSHMLQAQRPPAHQPSQPGAASVSFASSYIEMREVAAAAQASPLWQLCTDAYGRHYVLNTVTGETQWVFGS